MSAKSQRFLASRRAAEKRGRRSESWAALLLLLKGYRILGRRVRTHAGEIDLIARSPRGIVCFIEVKARENVDDALQSLRPQQRQRIARAAALYLAARPGLAAKGLRFDTVTVARRSWPRHSRDAWRPDGA
jgi:putative endonuclease